MMMDRSTPPPPDLSYPLTPPPTAGFNKRDSFDNIKVAGTNSSRPTLIDEGESLAEFFDEPREASDIELSDSEESTVSPNISTEPGSPGSSISSPNSNTTELQYLLTNPIKASIATSPFPFLELPLSIRNNIYHHLLTIPALICLRQKHTGTHGPCSTQPQDRALLPGIASASAHHAVAGPSIPFSRFPSTNPSILLTSKEIFAEAKAVLYIANTFAIPRPSTELTPPCDFSVRLFPPGCQRLVPSLTMRIRSFYDLSWLLDGGCNVMKNYYRGVESLVLILEIDDINRGFGRQWGKREGEEWEWYVKRLRGEIVRDWAGEARAVPRWIGLRVVFGGERYDGERRGNGGVGKKDELRRALVEAWEGVQEG
ncbi:hypothetical protein HBI24_211740 [Parastagonospora nodorum]|nr:hypothetical protein HBI24_211740 [Parastagonospora nodorum]